MGGQGSGARGGGAGQVALWGRNVTSSEFFNGGGGTTGFFGYSQRYYQAPATYGAELSYRFG